jgi:hypothetical protein
LIVCVCACVRRERETEREPRVANGRSGGASQAHARERGREQKGQDTTRMKRTGKNALQWNGRLFDALPLVVARALVGDGDDVLFSSSLLALRFSLARSLSFALYATSVLSSRAALLTLLAPTPFFRCSSRFFSVKRPATTAHNKTTTYFPSPSSSSQLCECTTRPFESWGLR